MQDTIDITPYGPAHNYPTTYRGSSTEIEFASAGHGHICGSARRTGLTLEEGWPVYELHSWAHPELNGWLVALSPAGFVLRGRSTITREG